MNHKSTAIKRLLEELESYQKREEKLLAILQKQEEAFLKEIESLEEAHFKEIERIEEAYMRNLKTQEERFIGVLQALSLESESMKSNTQLESLQKQIDSLNL